jgi:hypothetical protein
LCPIAGFGISGVGHSGSAIAVLFIIPKITLLQEFKVQCKNEIQSITMKERGNK